MVSGPICADQACATVPAAGGGAAPPRSRRRARVRPGGVVGVAVERAAEVAAGRPAVGTGPDEASKRLQCPDRIGGLGRSSQPNAAPACGAPIVMTCERPGSAATARAASPAIECAMTHRGWPRPSADRVERPAQPGHDIVEPAAAAIVGIAM